MRQDLRLCTDILLLRQFSRVYDRHKQIEGSKDARGVRKKQKEQGLAKEEMDFLAMAEKLSKATER